MNPSDPTRPESPGADSKDPTATPAWDLIVALKAVQRGLVTPAELSQARKAQAEQASGNRPLSQILVDRGFLGIKEWAKMVDEAQRETQSERLPGSRTSLPEVVGPYRILREVGRGGTGIVFEARHAQGGQRTALKLLVPDEEGPFPQTSQDLARVAREALTMAQLPPHPGIVRVMDTGISEDQPYIATEYIEGLPLADWILKHRGDLASSIRLLQQVALAIHHAHEGGVLHRGLNTKNVLVNAHGRPYVTDFGHARQIRSDHGATSTSQGRIRLMAAYMSPEQAGGVKAIDRRTDVYSLGAILYEILSGHAPFGNEGSIATLIRVIYDPIPPLPATLVGGGIGIDDSLRELCMKALSKDPAERYATALEFAQALSGWLDRDPLTQREEKGGRPARFTRTTILLGVLIGLLGVGLLLLWVTGSFRHP